MRICQNRERGARVLKSSPPYEGGVRLSAVGWFSPPRSTIVYAIWKCQKAVWNYFIGVWKHVLCHLEIPIFARLNDRPVTSIAILTVNIPSPPTPLSPLVDRSLPSCQRRSGVLAPLLSEEGWPLRTGWSPTGWWECQNRSSLRPKFLNFPLSNFSFPLTVHLVRK